MTRIIISCSSLYKGWTRLYIEILTPILFFKKKILKTEWPTWPTDRKLYAAVLTSGAVNH